MRFGAKEERYCDELESLQDLVRRLKRMTTKEGANFEYLKNVVLNYMLRLEQSLMTSQTCSIFSKPSVRNLEWLAQTILDIKNYSFIYEAV